MYAVVKIKGKQYRAEAGADIQVDRLEGDPGAEVDFDSVMLLGGDTAKIGSPYVKDAKVSAVILEHTRGKKVRVYKYKRRKNYARTRGHRQDYTVLQIKEITGA